MIDRRGKTRSKTVGTEVDKDLLKEFKTNKTLIGLSPSNHDLQNLIKIFQRKGGTVYSPYVINTVEDKDKRLSPLLITSSRWDHPSIGQMVLAKFSSFFPVCEDGLSISNLLSSFLKGKTSKWNLPFGTNRGFDPFCLEKGIDEWKYLPPTDGKERMCESMVLEMVAAEMGTSVDEIKVMLVKGTDEKLLEMIGQFAHEFYYSEVISQRRPLIIAFGKSLHIVVYSLLKHSQRQKKPLDDVCILPIDTEYSELYVPCLNDAFGMIFEQ